MNSNQTAWRVLARAVAPSASDAAVGAFFREPPRVGTTMLVSSDRKTLQGTLDAEAPHRAHLLVA